MDSDGQLYPILVTDKLEVVDGHRRLAAAKKLSWKSVNVLINSGGGLAAMYTAVNSTGQRLSGNENIQVYLANPDAVTKTVRKRLEDMESVVGRKVVERMAKEGFSPGTWTTALKIAKEADSTGDVDFLKKAVMWLIKYRCADKARRAINIGTPLSKIVAAINNDKPIRISYA